MTRPGQPDDMPQPFCPLERALEAIDREAQHDAKVARAFGLGLALGLLLLLLTACGGGDPEPLTPAECAALANSAPPYSAQRPLPQECTP